jgi:hypothetical protein
VRLYSSPSTRANDLAILSMRLASNRSEGSSPRSIQAMYLSRQSPVLGTGSVSMDSASLEPYSSSRASTYASFEGSSSMGSTPVGFEEPPRILHDSRVGLEVDGRLDDVLRKNVWGNGDSA